MNLKELQDLVKQLQEINRDTANLEALDEDVRDDKTGLARLYAAALVYQAAKLCELVNHRYWG
jgi:hypothetical protein